MKVRIRDIPPEGLIINDTISLTNLNGRMNERSKSDIEFILAPRVNLTIQRTPLGAEVRGSVSTRYKQPCGLCADLRERELEIETSFIFKPKPLNVSGEDWEDDVGICYYEGEHIELEELIQESLILQLSLAFQPPQDENGVCLICGKKFEGEKASKDEKGGTKLGDLLKDVRVH